MVAHKILHSFFTTSNNSKAFRCAAIKITVLLYIAAHLVDFAAPLSAKKQPITLFTDRLIMISPHPVQLLRAIWNCLTG